MPDNDDDSDEKYIVRGPIVFCKSSFSTFPERLLDAIFNRAYLEYDFYIHKTRTSEIDKLKMFFKLEVDCDGDYHIKETIKLSQRDIRTVNRYISYIFSGWVATEFEYWFDKNKNIIYRFYR